MSLSSSVYPIRRLAQRAPSAVELRAPSLPVGCESARTLPRESGTHGASEENLACVGGGRPPSPAGPTPRTVGQLTPKTRPPKKAPSRKTNAGAGKPHGKGLPPPSPAAGARRAPQGSAEHRAGPLFVSRPGPEQLREAPNGGGTAPEQPREPGADASSSPIRLF